MPVSEHTALREIPFPDALKDAELAPVFKRDDNLNNFRPIGILPCVSKIFERVYNDQMVEYFCKVISKFLAAFRKGYSCETTVLKMVEDWKEALDNKRIVGAMLVDLSKAFDCLPHHLLLAKLHAYGLSMDSCNLIMSYLNKSPSTCTNWQYKEWMAAHHPGSTSGVHIGSVSFQHIHQWINIL